MEKYKVYKVEPRLYCYSGISLVAAENAEGANKIIDDFKQWDKENYADSWGYSNVDETDCIEGLYSEKEGIIIQDIYYRG